MKEPTDTQKEILDGIDARLAKATRRIASHQSERESLQLKIDDELAVKEALEADKRKILEALDLADWTSNATEAPETEA